MGESDKIPIDMNASGDNEIWTAPRLTARLVALRGVAPAPSCYLIWRVTHRPGLADTAGYQLPDIAGLADDAAFTRWLSERDLSGVERLTVSVLVIRETLDACGLVEECVLERRRGACDGPYFGKVARVEFTGAATRVRRYQAAADGRLSDLPAEDEPDATPLPDDPDTESFVGEDAAVHAFLGSGAVILDRRAPALFEDLAGLSGVIHARRADGVEFGCGVGWHGTTSFVIPADFPRQGGTLTPPPDLEAAVTQALAAHDLIRHETRLDEQGFCVMARRRDRQTLVAIRLDDGVARIEPYMPGRNAASSEDQRRWMIYAETYEGRTVLDSWRDGDGDTIVVLTIDHDQEAWRHIIDPDGIEVSRRSANDAGAAVLFRERGTHTPGAHTPGAHPRGAHPFGAAVARDQPGTELGTVWSGDAVPVEAEYLAPNDSLLAKVRAYLRVTALLRAATDACGSVRRNGQPVPPEALQQIEALREPLSLLNARFSSGSLQRLISQAEGGGMTLQAFAVALEDLVTRLRDELALTRIVLLPSAARQLNDDPPFGGRVEIRFPSAAYDIEEAVHCLALRRTTAAVLHAMKVMRHGLRGLAALLDVPPLANLSWAQLITAVREAGGERELIEALMRVRRIWHRPDLMPADKYTEEEAESVLEAVAAFMRTLAACFDARGEPLAE